MMARQSPIKGSRVLVIFQVYPRVCAHVRAHTHAQNAVHSLVG